MLPNFMVDRNHTSLNRSNLLQETFHNYFTFDKDEMEDIKATKITEINMLPQEQPDT